MPTRLSITVIRAFLFTAAAQAEITHTHHVGTASIVQSPSKMCFRVVVFPMRENTAAVNGYSEGLFRCQNYCSQGMRESLTGKPFARSFSHRITSPKVSFPSLRIALHPETLGIWGSIKRIASSNDARPPCPGTLSESA